jgi:hypothetical protein
MIKTPYRIVAACLAICASVIPGRADGLAGVWMCDASGWHLEMILQENGQYNTESADPQGQNPFWMSGTWQVFGNPMILRLEIEKWQPNQFCGPLGCSPTRTLSNETYQVYPSGADSLDMIGQNGARWSCQRNS